MSEVKVDTISERTAANGIVVDGVTIKDSGLTIPSGGTLDVNGTIDVTGATVSGLTTGKVLQVVQTVKTDKFTTTSTTFTDVTGLSVSITPSSSSNKILVQVVVNGASSSASSNSRNIIGLFKDSTQIALGDADGSRTQSSVDLSARSLSDTIILSGTIIFLDSPSTTSSITYAIKTITPLGSTSVINATYADNNTASNSRTISTITAMEIEG